MKCNVLLCCVVLCSVVSTLASTSIIDFDKRVQIENYRVPRSREVPHGWQLIRRANPDTDTLTLTIAVKPRNVETLEENFWAVSNPKSPRYGKYLTFEQVNDLVRPASATLASIQDWLVHSGIPKNVHSMTPAQDFIILRGIPVGVAEKLLQVEFNQFHHRDTGKFIFRALEDYSIPAHLEESISFVGGVHRFPRMKKSLDIVKTSDLPSGNSPIISRILPGDGELSNFILLRCKDGSIPQNANTLCASPSIDSITTLVDQTIPMEVHQKIPPNACRSCKDWNGSFNSLAYWCNKTVTQYQISSSSVFCSMPLIENVRNYWPAYVAVYTLFSDQTKSSSWNWPNNIYTGKFVTPETLADRYSLPPGARGTNPNNTQSVAEFLGQFYSPDDLNQFFDINGLPRQSVTLIGPNDASNPGGEASLDIQYIMGVAPNISTTFWSLSQLHEGQEPFLEWITQVLAAPKAPLVHSISYADDEDSLSTSYMQRINVEFMKAGNLGITLLFSSGDNGAASSNPPVNCPGHFVPAFPPGSPYVTVVGATQFSTQTRPICDLGVNGLPARCEEVGEIMSSTTTGSRITSGGGFSNVFSMPSYQSAVVQQYIQTRLQSIPSNWYNAKGRAYPDVAACGRNFLVIIGGALTPVDGTSAAAPTFAGIISLINDVRLNSNLPPLGFLNQFLYQVGPANSVAFHDIVMGNNSCPEELSNCCTYGLPSSVGWDAVTGWGTPNFPALLGSTPGLAHHRHQRKQKKQ